MQSYPKVFIVILNYNGQAVLHNCLRSVFKIDYPNFEVIVVDNDSRDESFVSARACFSKARFIKNEVNLGFAAGNNVGIRFALEKMADFVLLLNNDTEIEPSIIKNLLVAFDSDKQIGIASPVILHHRTHHIWFAGGVLNWPLMKTHHLTKIQNTYQHYDTGFVSGCAMMIKKEVFKKSGLLDEDFFLYWEDADFSLRAQRAGFKTVVIPQKMVYHFEQSEDHKLNKIYWLVLSGLLFFQKNTFFPFNLWFIIYISFRKLKNRFDMLKRKTPLAATIHQAYVDYKKINRL